MLDMKIRNALILDGAGSAPVRGDVGVRGDTVVRAGSCPEEASMEVDAGGRCLCPGFIDMHSHADLFYAFPAEGQPKLMQGVTTEVVGNCGLGVWPLQNRDREFLQRHLAGVMGHYPERWPWSDLAEWASHLEGAGVPVNLVPLAAHGALRLFAMGLAGGPSSGEPAARMESALEEALDQGAWGLSTGLIYPPACYSTREELLALCGVAARRGGFFAIHMRSEGEGLLEAVDEALALASGSGVSLEISHLKAYGKGNWHKADAVLEKIHAARAGGIDVFFDSYPYTYGSTTLTALLPPWVFEGGLRPERLRDPELRRRVAGDIARGVPSWESYIRQSGWDGILFSSGVTEKNLPFEGMSLAAIGEERGVEPVDALFDILGDEGAQASMLIKGMDEDGVRTIIRDELHLLGSDGLYGRKPHPRVYGAFPRLLKTYVRDEKALTLEEAVRQMTGAPARRLGLRDRGILAEGKKADLVLFDPGTVGDVATYDDPRRYPVGIELVVVNGVPAVRGGMLLDGSAGRVLRRGG